METKIIMNVMLKRSTCRYLLVLIVLAFTSLASASVITWDGDTSNQYTDHRNWVDGVRPANSTSTDIARFADNSTAVSYQPTVNYNWAVGGIQFDGAGWTIGRSGTYMLNIGGGVTLNPADAGSVTFNSKLYLGASQTWNVSAGSTINVNGGVGGASSTLTKTGSGRMVIRGGVDNTNTLGAIVVSAGELMVTSGTLDQRLAAVSVNSGALLGGAGSILRPVTIDDGGILSAGFDAAGTLTVGNLFLNDSSALEFELDSLAGTSDLIVTDDLVLDGQLNLTDLGGLESGIYTLFSYSGSLTDNGLNINSAPTGFDGNISTDASGVYLNVIAVPEPTTLGLMGCSFATLMILRRRFI